MPGVRREDLAPADDSEEGRRSPRKRPVDSALHTPDRLEEVVLFGPWVRGQAHEESDVDLLVVLDEVVDRARERDRIVDALFDLEADSKRAIEAFPVALSDAREPTRPFVKAALTEGVLLLRGRRDGH